MATKPSWLTVSPMAGSGNDTLQNTASAHTGRLVRTGTVTVTAVGVSLPKTYSVTQEAKAEFISIDNGATMAADKSGGKVTVTGTYSGAYPFTFRQLIRV
ncbi:BACON domain-containing protein [Phocaeicola coprophilus]|uniref:BACON domain-containing protein n=1 Tax=Phocaeicola coprophilus TaxID=387090 RepID=UPI00399647B2